MSAKKSLSNPQAFYIFIMLIQFVILLGMMIPVFKPMVFLLFLFVVFSMALRLRFNLKPIYMLIDEAIIILVSIFYPPSYLCLGLFGLYFAYKNKLLYLSPLILIGFLLNDRNYYLFLVQAIFFGIILYQWTKDNIINIEITDQLRRRIYELEFVQSRLLSDFQDTERISRLTERQRIAEILHDSLGHELTAAHLSLKAYKTLLEINKPYQAQKTLNKIEEKIEYSLAQLKDSVKYIEPIFETGFHDLTYLIENYIYPINFTHNGPITKLKSYIWQLILMSAKEALTNITKHATPEKINIYLEVTDYIVRLIIENDGINSAEKNMSGSGIRYMRNRLEAINGSLSVQIQDTYKLIIIIPIKDGID